MSLAKVRTTKKAQKEWKCGKCGRVIQKGETVHHFAVGFRARSQQRCDSPGCYPKPSERESSLVSSVYAAQEDFDVEDCNTQEEIDERVEDVAAACEEVADEYESSEMFERNEDLQERASLLRDAADTLRDWADSLEEEPTPEAGDLAEDHADWLEEARETAKSAVNDVELP